MRTLVSILFVAAMLWAAPAMACSIANFLVVDGLGSEEAPTLSNDGAFPFRVDTLYSSLTVTVTDADGNAYSGAITEYQSDYGVWTPDEPLAPGRYTVSVSEFDNGGDASGVLEVTEAELAAPVVGAVSLEMTQRPSEETNCCARSTEDSCRLETCGDYDGCTVCWAVRNEYYPTLVPSIDNPPSAYVIETTVTTGERTFTNVAVGTGADEAKPPRVELPPGTEGPYCLTVELIDTAGASLGTSEERCFEADEFPVAGPTERDNSAQMSQCVEEPDNEVDPNWTEFEEKPPGTKEPVGGCSTTGQGAGSSFVLMFLGLFLIRSRR